MSAPHRPELPATFERVRRDVAGFAWRADITIDPLPAPQRIAPYSLAIGAEVLVHGAEVGTGRLIILHDPNSNPAWDGEFRCVSFAKAEADVAMVTDDLVADVGWSWLLEGLVESQAAFTAPAGTVTAVVSKSFGGIADDAGTAELEIRASWTPQLSPDGAGIQAHLQAWTYLLCQTAGLPPLAPGVVPLPARRRSR